jgi:hypothetical protein
MSTTKPYSHIEAQRSTGDWNPVWDQLFDMDPDYLEAFLHFRSVPQTKGPLEQKYKELIFIAINATTTHFARSRRKAPYTKRFKGRRHPSRNS